MELEELAEPDWLPEDLYDQPHDTQSECEPDDTRCRVSDYPIWLDDGLGWVDAYEM